MNHNRIRILFVVPDLRVGGAERQLVTLVTRMDPARFSPSVVCIGDEGDFFAELTAAGVTARALHLRKRNALKVLWALVVAMRQQRTDVVVVRGYNAEALGRIAARIAGVAHTILWAHNIGDAEPRGCVRAAADRVLDRWTTSYFGVAEAQRRYLVDELHYPEAKIRIIYNGVDPTQFDVTADRDVRAEFGLAAGDPVVGIVAALRPEKDHATFLRAARLVVEARPETKFLVVGDGPMRARLEMLCEELSIAPNVVFAGSRHDIGRLLRTMDVFVLSSRTVECFPIALLEAMACARPAICTDIGGIPEIVADGVTGYLVPPCDPRRLAERLLSLLSDPAGARRMGRAARVRLEAEFDLDRSIRATQRAIGEVAGVGRRERMNTPQ